MSVTITQAESGQLSGTASVASAINGFEGDGYVLLPAAGRDDPFGDQPAAQPGSVTFTVEVPQDGWYTLNFRYANGHFQ